MADATGGTITYAGGKTIHTFTSNGTFVVPKWSIGSPTVEVLVVAGGGGGGGGGAGGLGGGGNGRASTGGNGYNATYYGGGGGGGYSSSSSAGGSGYQGIVIISYVTDQFQSVAPTVNYLSLPRRSRIPGALGGYDES